MLIWVQSTLVVLFRVIFNFGLVIAVYIAVFVSTGTISDAAVFHVNRLDKIQNTLPRLVHRVVVFGKDTRKKLPEKYKYLNKYIGHLHYRRGRSTYNCTASCIARYYRDRSALLVRA